MRMPPYEYCLLATWAYSTVNALLSERPLDAVQGTTVMPIAIVND